MKINKSHLIQQDNATNEQVRALAAVSLNEYNYGLLPAWPSETGSFEVSIIVDKQKSMRVIVFCCKALTPGGIKIDIEEKGQGQEFFINLQNWLAGLKDQEKKSFYLSLSADLFNRVPTGDILQSEDPPRFPYAVPNLSLNLIAEEDLAKNHVSMDSVIIGKVILGREEIEVAKKYIPACTSLKSHHDLIAYHTRVEQFLGRLELFSLDIIKKVREKKQDSILASSVLRLCLRMIDYMGPLALKVKWEHKNMAPIYSFESLASLARIMNNDIQSNTSMDMEELINYFTLWSELKQGDFEKLLSYCTNFNYDHNEIGESVDQFDEFMTIIESLFNKLSELAFIGKKKETNIFVKEHKTKRSFLAD